MSANTHVIDTVAEDLGIAYIDYSFRAAMFSNDYPEPEDSLVEVNGEISCLGEHGVAYKHVGSVRWFRLDARLAEEGGALLSEVIDVHSGTAQYADLVDAEDECLNERIRRQFKLPYGTGNVLIGDRIYVNNKYRGHGMAARIVDDAARRFFDMELIAIMPFPLQLNQSPDHEEGRWGNATDLAGFPSDPDIATTKLTNYYRRLGFAAIPDTSLMGMPNRYFRESRFGPARTDVCRKSS